MSETVWNVKADQPYSTEQQAASDIANPERKSYMALPTLLGARAQHNVDNRNYAEQIGQQRDYAYNALAAKIAEQDAKNAIEIAKNENPAALTLLAGNPSTANAFRGMNPDAAGWFTNWASRMATAKMADLVGKGAQGMLQGGIQMAPGSAQDVTGMQTSAGVPPIVQAAQIRAQSAEGRGGGSGGYSVEFTGPDTPPKITRKNVPASEIGPLIQNQPGLYGTPRSVDKGNTHSDRPNIGGTGQSTTTQSAPPAAPNLQPGDKATVDTGTAIIRQRANQIPKQHAADIAGSTNFQRDAKTGDIYVVGKSGEKYRIGK